MTSSTSKTGKLSKKEQIRTKRRKRQRRNQFAIIGAVTLVAIAIAAILIVQNKPVSSANFNRPQVYTRSQTNGTYAGDPNAPVKVEEFGDFNCIHCENFWQTSEAQLLNSYVNTGKVYFHYVPMSFISATSATAAEAAYCAMDQDKFFEFHDYIFANYGVGLSDSLLQAFASDLGLDMNQFNSCYSSNKYANQVAQDEQYASSKGVTGTPTFDVNGTLVGQDSLFTQIDSVLGE